MRRDPPNSQLTARSREPRVAVAIIFPTGSIYLTNRPGISNVPGNVVNGVLKGLSSTSQEIFPEEGRATIGTLSFTAVDLAGAVTDELREQLLVELRGVRGREVRVYTGDTDDFTDGTWQRVETYVVDGPARLGGRNYVFSCSDRNREQRVEIFDQKKTRLASTLTAAATSVVVTSTSGFNLVPHNAAYTDAPSSTVGYIRIEQTGEIIRYTGTSGGNTFTGCTRGVFNTVAQECVVDGAVGVDRRPEVVEFIYLEGSAAALDYAIKTGSVLENLVANGSGEIGTAGAQATSWTLGAGNNLTPSTDHSSVGPRSLRIVNGAVATDSYSYQDITLVGGATYVLEGLIKTTAMASGDAGFGAALNTATQSGIGSYTILSKTTVGADPGATIPAVGIAADGVAHDWTYVASKFIPASNGVMRVFCQVGLGGGQTGNGWFDGVRVRRAAQLPSTWHMGIDEAYVDSYQYDALGADLSDPIDPTAGLILRFTHLEKTDGKRFSEEQLHIPMQTFAPIDANGVIGIRRITPVLELSAPSAELTPNTVIQCDSIEHALNDVVNRIKVNWNWDGERYTRTDLFLHAGSIAKHKVGPVKEFNLRGLTVQRHSRETIQRIANNLFERRAAPPIRSNVRMSRALNALEVGDTQRMALPSIRDFTAAATLNRVVELQSRRINWLTGELHGRIFGSTERMAPDALAGSGAILSDAWYSSAGVALNTVLTMVGNAVTASGALTGNVDLRQAVYYHLGDLTINSGVIVTLGQNVQLRVRGTLTVNGTLNGAGGGIPGLTSPDVVSQNGNHRPFVGPSGFFGSTMSSDGVYTSATGVYFNNYAGNAQIGAVMTMPRLNLSVAASALIGIPADLRGARGAWGPPVSSGSQLGSVVAKGGDGGAGGAGLMIVSRGTVAFGASGTINLSGGNGGVPPATGVLNGVTLYGGAGAGGAPGCLVIVLDGNNVTSPDLSVGFIADQGLTPQTGTPAQYNLPNLTLNFPAQPGTGVGAGFSGADHWRAAHVVQYVPSAIELGDSAEEIVPAPAALAGVGSFLGAEIVWTNPAPNKFDFVELWRATTNDRAGAVRVFSGVGDAFSDRNTSWVTRYYWVRAGRENGGFSAWYPSGATSGVAVTFGERGTGIGWIADSQGKPAGIRGVSSTTTRAQLHLENGKLKIQSAPDTNVQYGFPAIPVNDAKQYLVTVCYSGSAASANGFNFGGYEKASALAAGTTHIGSTTFEPNIVDGSAPVLATVLGNLAIATTETVVSGVYTPQSGSKFLTLTMGSLVPATAGVDIFVHWVSLVEVGTTVDLLPGVRPPGDTVDLVPEAASGGFQQESDDGPFSVAGAASQFQFDDICDFTLTTQPHDAILNVSVTFDQYIGSIAGTQDVVLTAVMTSGNESTDAYPVLGSSAEPHTRTIIWQFNYVGGDAVTLDLNWAAEVIGGPPNPSMTATFSNVKWAAWYSKR